MRGLGTAGGFKLLVQDRAGAGRRRCRRRPTSCVERGASRADRRRRLHHASAPATPQLFADVDRVKANKLNVPLGNVFDTLQVYLGSSYVNDFNRFGRTFQVRAQAEGDFRADPE